MGSTRRASSPPCPLLHCCSLHAECRELCAIRRTGLRSTCMLHARRQRTTACPSRASP
jgi:hypothetical protein